MRATGDGCSTAHVALLGPYLCMEHCSGRPPSTVLGGRPERAGSDRHCSAPEQRCYLREIRCSGGVAARGSEHCSEVAGDSLLGGVLTFITIVWVLFGCHTHQLRTRIAH